MKRTACDVVARVAIAAMLAASSGTWPASASARESDPQPATAGPSAVPTLAVPASASPDVSPAALSASAAVTVARQKVAAGDVDGAIALLQLFVTSHPADVEAARYLGDLYYRKSNFAAAERTYLGILHADPKDRETYNRLGGVYAAEDRVPDAIDAFTRSLPNTGAYGRLTDLHRRYGDLAAFESRLRGEAESEPQNAEAQYAIGVVDHSDRKYDEAASYLQRALYLDPSSCPILAELGSTDIDLGRPRDSVGYFERCLDHDRDNYPALVNLGVANTQLGDETHARQLFERAMRARADGPEAIVDIGFLDDLAGRWQSAIQHYLRALSLDPLERDAYLDLGYDYNEHGLFALAEAAFLKGLSAAPDDGRLHYLLGVTYAGQGKRALARTEYERAAHSDEPEVVRAATRDLAAFGT